MLLGAIDVTDDTKMMSKALIEEMATSSESLTSIMESKHGRTVGCRILEETVGCVRALSVDLICISKY